MSENQTGVMWTRAKEFTREIQRGRHTERLAVVVAKSDQYPFPRYSTKMGALRTNKENQLELFPFINPFVTEQVTGESVVDESLLIVAGLMQEAHSWIKEDADEEAARIMEARKSMDEVRAKTPALPELKPTTPRSPRKVAAGAPEVAARPKRKVATIEAEDERPNG